MDIRIVPLADAPGAAEVLADWFVAEWEPWYGPEGRADVQADLAARAGRDRLPLCLVALGPDGAVMGTAALETESVGSELGVGPWLAAFLVAPEYRRRGVGAALVRAIEAAASRFGCDAVYTSTAAGALFEGLGWERFGGSESLRGPVAVYRRAVTPP